MHSILAIVGPVFGVVLVGYVATWRRLFDEPARLGLSRFVFSFSIPCLLFRSLATAELTPEIPWSFLLSYYLATFTVFGLGMLISRRLFARPLDEQGIFGFCAAFGNVVLLGVPLILTSFGQTAALPLFLIIAVHSLLLMPTVTVVIELGRGQRAAWHQLAGNVARQLLRNPILLALFAGLTTNLAGLRVPTLLDDGVRLLGSAALPCALFVLGASLSQFGVSGSLREVAVITVLKGLLQPLLVWLLGTQVFHIEPLWVAVAVMLAAQPTGVMPYLFAQRYGLCVPMASTAVFVSTTSSVLSLSVLLFLLGV